MPAPSTCTVSLIGGAVVGGVAAAALGGEVEVVVAALGGVVEVVVAALGGVVVAGVTAAAASVVGFAAGGLGTDGAAASAAVDTVTGLTSGPHAARSRIPATESATTESGRFPR
jgi:hypothetical protein